MSMMLNQMGIDRLTKEQRLELIGEIWDSIDSLDDLELSETLREELDRRLAAADSDPAGSKPWAEVRARLLGEL